MRWPPPGAGRATIAGIRAKVVKRRQNHCRWARHAVRSARGGCPVRRPPPRLRTSAVLAEDHATPGGKRCVEQSRIPQVLRVECRCKSITRSRNRPANHNLVILPSIQPRNNRETTEKQPRNNRENAAIDCCLPLSKNRRNLNGYGDFLRSDWPDLNRRPLDPQSTSADWLTRRNSL